MTWSVADLVIGRPSGGAPGASPRALWQFRQLSFPLQRPPAPTNPLSGIIAWDLHGLDLKLDVIQPFLSDESGFPGPTTTLSRTCTQVRQGTMGDYRSVGLG